MASSTPSSRREAAAAEQAVDSGIVTVSNTTVDDGQRVPSVVSNVPADVTTSPKATRASRALGTPLISWTAVEEAMWDAIGKISGQPVSRLLGAKTSSLPVYFTYVWPGDPTQDHVPFKEQAAQALRLKNAGF